MTDGLVGLPIFLCTAFFFMRFIKCATRSPICCTSSDLGTVSLWFIDQLIDHTQQKLGASLALSLVVGRLVVYFGRFYGLAIFASLSGALAALKVSHARCVPPRLDGMDGSSRPGDMI